MIRYDQEHIFVFKQITLYTSHEPFLIKPLFMSGFSSGYDSSNVSDSDMNSQSICSDEGVVSSSDDDCDDVKFDNFRAQYKNKDALCWQLSYITSLEELCDVTFLVGPNKTPVHGVKAILGTRSRYIPKNH